MSLWSCSEIEIAAGFVVSGIFDLRGSK
jgi:hypothetical protein